MQHLIKSFLKQRYDREISEQAIQELIININKFDEKFTESLAIRDNSHGNGNGKRRIDQVKDLESQQVKRPRVSIENDKEKRFYPSIPSVKTTIPSNIAQLGLRSNDNSPRFLDFNSNI